MNRESSTKSGRHSERSGHANGSQNAHCMLRYSHSTYQPPTTCCSSPSDNASTARARGQFPKSYPPADTRECAEKSCRPIARQSCPTVPTIPRPPLSSRTSSNQEQIHGFKDRLNQSRPRCNDGRIHIAMLKKKSDAKSFNKAINKHGLDALHLATELAAATAT